MNNGVTVRSVARDSPFYAAGIRKGDLIRSINGDRIFSELDFHFFIAEERLLLTIERNGRSLPVAVERSEGDFSGVTLVEQPIRRCANRCIFCFIDQMPPGLRKSLYVKDEDVRLSVFNGNYVTLSNFKNTDLDHLARIGLSPLYVSVHATDSAVRRQMLRNRKAPPVLDQLSRLAENGIRFHTQIVVCPGWNDGEVLAGTVRDLLSMGDAVLSVAVVPVGLTRFRTIELMPVDRNGALAVCRSISRLSDRAARRDGVRKVFLADEFFIKARLPIPDVSYYEEYPQIENGVGLVRQLLEGWSRIKPGYGDQKRRRRCRKGKKLLVTSVSAYPFIRSIIDECTRLRPEVTIDVAAVTNNFFGDTVTVAGLLTATDILKEIRRRCADTPVDEVLIPSVIFNYAGFTLDGFSAARMAKVSGKPLHVIETIEELVKL